MAGTQLLNEADFMQKLHSYTYQQRRLHASTLFATITITNYQTLVSHTTMVDALGDFLREQLIVNQLEYRSLKTTVQPQYISIRTLQALTKLFLENNSFYFNGQIYGFTRGAPNTFQLSETLANICLCLWQLGLFQSAQLQNEFYGR